MENLYLQPNQPQVKNKRLKQVVVVFAVLFVLSMVLSWLYSHSFIKIRTDGLINGETRYELVDQTSKKSIVINSKSPTVKKLVKKGIYEVLARNKETSSFSVVSTKPFLGTTNVNSQLKQEKSRSFVGNNPLPCMYYGQEILFTFSCAADYGSLTAHLPASSETPTTTSNPEDAPPEVPIGGIVNLSGKDLVLLNNVTGGEGSDEQPHRLYGLNLDMQLANYTALPGLDQDKPYTIKNYQQGFLVYDSSYQNIFYYDNLSAQPKKIGIDKPDNSELAGQQFSIEGDHIAVAYSNPNRVLEPDEKGEIKGGETTAVQIYASGKTKSFLFDGSFYLAQVCAAKYLCLVQDRDLVVYDISTDEAKEVTRIGNVYNVKTAGDKLLVVRYDGVLEYDIQNQSGFLQYSFGGYSPCGVEISQSKGYLLCLVNPKEDKVALYIDPGQNNSDSIDKKILKLLDLSYISNVSAYKSFIYISPELGELEYDGNINGYVPNPEIRQKANHDIDSLINELDINRSIYNVINTQQ